MIYTTYFAQLRNLPKNIVPISICGKAPSWYEGFQYKKLAPKYGFFAEWKKTHDNDYYIKHFNEEVLCETSIREVVEDFVAIIKSLPKMEEKYRIALVCYEKPGDFCHRHLVAEWLTENGLPCQEWEKG